MNIFLMGIIGLLACGDKETDTGSTDTNEETTDTSEETTDTGEETTDTGEDTSDTGEDTDTTEPGIDVDSGIALYASFDNGSTFEGDMGALVIQNSQGGAPATSSGGVSGTEAMSETACFSSNNIMWNGPDAISFSFWIQPSPQVGSHQVFAHDYGAFQVKADIQGVVVEVYQDGDRQVFQYRLGNELGGLAWTHVAFSLDTAQQIAYGWINGGEVLVSENTPLQIQTGMGTQNGTFRILRDNCGSQMGAPLRIDELRIYDVPITKSQASALAAQ